MELEHYRFGGDSSGSVLHPLVALALVVCIIVILRRPRREVLAAMLFSIFLIPKGQVLVFAGAHFFVYRIVILAGLVRWAMSRRSPALAGGFNSIDRAFTLWALSSFIIFSLQWMESQALIKAAGDLLDALGGYFTLRYLIHDREDIRRTVRILAFVAIVLGICMINEQRTGANVFGPLGGILPSPELRNGSIRSQGSFQHSITAGSFGATLIPLLIWLWSDGKSRKLAALGLIGATVMALTPHSSTTLSCYAISIFGLCVWPLRKYMRVIRFGLAATLIGLHMAMNGPVWSILEHINLTGSSESYHRYQLIDTFIHHFGDWWLLGTRDNGSWGWQMMDTSNQYVTWGVNGGLITFVLFIVIIIRCFGKIGTARKRIEGNRKEEWFLWCLGSVMFAHVVVYFGIDYFDQMQFAWFAFLAMISVAVYATASIAVPAVQKQLRVSLELQADVPLEISTS